MTPDSPSSSRGRLCAPAVRAKCSKHRVALEEGLHARGGMYCAEILSTLSGFGALYTASARSCALQAGCLYVKIAGTQQL